MTYLGSVRKIILSLDLTVYAPDYNTITSYRMKILDMV